MISDSINKFEIYFVPVCFLLGLLGNLLGTITILTAKKLRKRTIFFILSIIGITDSILLASQMQRWLAINLDEQFYLINNSLCKFYLMLVRSSVLITSSLLLAISISSVIRLYLGQIHLSTHSKLGQILSKLCVLISIALSMSVSWHELWTSGLRNSTHSIHLIEIQDEDGFEIDSYTPPTTQSDLLICSKNIDSILIIELINYIYFTICILINLFLIFNTALICIKLKRVNFCSKICNDTIIVTRIVSIGSAKASLKQESFSNIASNDQTCLAVRASLNKSYGTEANLKKSFSIDSKEIMPTTSKNSISNFNKKTSVSKHLAKSNSNLKNFTHFIVVVSLVSSLFCLPFVAFDLIFYRDVLVDTIKINNSTTNLTVSNQVVDSTIRLPLIFINIPHMIKFYLLFVLNSKFRSQLSHLIRFRLYFNPNVLRRISFFHKSNQTSSVNTSHSHHAIPKLVTKNKKTSNEISAYLDDEMDPDDNVSNLVSTDINTPPKLDNNKQDDEHEAKQSFEKSKTKTRIEFKFSFYPNCLPFLVSTNLNHSK